MINEHDKENKVQYLELSLDEFSRVQDLDIRTDVNKQWHDRSRMPDGMGSRWYGGLESLDDAKSVMRNGWKEGAEKLSGLRSAVGAGLGAKTRRRKKVWGEQGDEISIDRAMRGDWDTAFRTARRVWAPGSTHIDLAVQWGGNCDVSAEEMFWSGAQLVVLADLLEDAGYAVRVRAFHCGESYEQGGGLQCTMLNIKEYEQAFQTDAVASIVCHAGIFRTYGFECILATPWPIGSGLGSAVKWEQTDAEFLKSPLLAELQSPDMRVLGAVRSKESCVANIRKVLGEIEGQT